MNNQEQKTILLVEDEDLVMKVETQLLKSFGYDIVTAKSGEEAIQIATGNDKIDLILMDINLGDGMDGTEAARQILEKRHLPIVFLTSHTEEKYVERAKKITRYGYVMKNFDTFVIQSSIAMAFELFGVVKALQEANQRMEYILGATKTGLDIIDADFNLVYVDPEWTKIYGDFKGRKCHEYFMGRETACPNCGIITALQTKQIIVTEEMLIKEGNRPIQVTTIPFQNEKGEWFVAEVNVDITERKHTEDALWERIKELNCLYAISDLTEKNVSLDKILQGSVDLMPTGWSCPEIACARIIFKGHQYQTGNFRETDCRQSADIIMDGRHVGLIELYYLKERPGRGDALFLREENKLINAIAKRLGMVAERKQAEEALMFKTMLLEAQAETSTDGILAVDNDGRSILFNKRFGEIWKIPQSVLDTKDDKKMLEYVLKQLKDPGEFIRKVAHLYEHKDDKSNDEIEFADGRCLERYSAPLISADGKHQGRIWYFHDITERKKMEKMLRENQQC